MLNIKLTNCIRNTEMRRRTGIQDKYIKYNTTQMAIHSSCSTDEGRPMEDFTIMGTSCRQEKQTKTTYPLDGRFKEDEVQLDTTSPKWNIQARHRDLCSAVDKTCWMMMMISTYLITPLSETQIKFQVCSTKKLSTRFLHPLTLQCLILT